MAVRKRNEFLESDDSDEELDHGYDSEANEESRGNIAGRNNKRRRLDPASDDESFDALDDDDDDGPVDDTRPTDILQEADEAEHADEEADKVTKPTKSKPSTPKQITTAAEAAKRSGVIYISRVPPFMKPSTLASLLSPHAPSGLGRIFLTPEDHIQHARRVKNGGNRKKSYTDGWVEFVSKREAKVCVELLNGGPVGGKKGGFYRDDLWSLRYLRGFKWAHLTEQINAENAERSARMREEVRRMGVENRRFVEGVERGKMLSGVKGTREAREAKGGDADDAVSVDVEKNEEAKMSKRETPKKFKQKMAKPTSKGKDVPEQMNRMKGLIF